MCVLCIVCVAPPSVMEVSCVSDVSGLSRSSPWATRSVVASPLALLPSTTTPDDPPPYPWPPAFPACGCSCGAVVYVCDEFRDSSSDVWSLCGVLCGVCDCGRIHDSFGLFLGSRLSTYLDLCLTFAFGSVC